MRRIFAIVVIIGLLGGGMLACAPKEVAPPAKPEVVYLNLGSTSTVSGIYVYAVAITRVINKYAPGVEVTCIEAGGTYDDLARVREGIFDFGTASGHVGVYEMYAGRGQFEGDPWKEVRCGFLREINTPRMYATVASGAKYFHDLKGEAFAPGMPGSWTYVAAHEAGEVLGLDLKLLESSLGDAIKAVKDGRSLGVAKASPTHTYDASVLGLHVGTPMTPVGFTEEEAERIMKACPTRALQLTPKGKVQQVPDFSQYEYSNFATTFFSTRLPEDVVYKIIKAVYEHHDEVADAFPPCGLFDPLKTYMERLPEVQAVPFHAGIVRYAEEIGIEVPQYLIPPEYKGK